MKKLLSLTALTLALSLTSCAHHGCCGKQCEMKDKKCEQCKMHEGMSKEQCHMKGDAKTDDKKTEEVKK